MTRFTTPLLPLLALIAIGALIDNEVHAAPDASECSDGIDNNAANGTDWPADPSCYGPDDPTEDGVPACMDGIDNDLDGATDWPADSDCDSADDPDEATLRQCQNRVDDDSNGLSDFDTDPQGHAPSDPSCHSPFDSEEYPVGFTPEEVYGRILVIFDTSGSMNRNTCTDDFTGGDGSADFPGDDVACADLPPECAGTPAADLCDNGLADDSRLHQVKAAATNVINSFGEVEYAMMRFQQRGVEFQPPTAVDSLPSGGWQGAGTLCGDFAGGEVVVAFSPDNPPTLLEWIDGQHDYLGGYPPAPMLPPARLDWELRGTGLTPLAGALGDALTYLRKVKEADPVEVSEPDCRPYRVVLITDGLESCGGDPVAAAGALLELGFPVEVIAFSTTSTEVTAALNAIAAAGSGDPLRQAMSASDQATLSSALARIISATIMYEICNGIDDDCDTDVDEDFPDKGETCNNGRQGICFEEGTVVCDFPPDFPFGDGGSSRCLLPGLAPLPNELSEGCNGLDDNCDGQIDEGLTCTCCGHEICNGLDDDWDGDIDEGHCVDDGAGDTTCNARGEAACVSAVGCLWQPLPGVGEECGSDIGLCELGVLACVDPDNNPLTANSALACMGGMEPATHDPCNGWDDDCDAQVDEDFGAPCYPAATEGCTWDAILGEYECSGICRPGNLECVDPTPAEPENGDSHEGSCAAYAGPGTESCNGIDDDCDGDVDEDWNPDSSGSSQGGACSNGLLGVCEALGSWVCNVADPDGPLVCTAPIITPGVEVCNGLDDDCDELIDEPDPDGIYEIKKDCYPFGLLGCTGDAVTGFEDDFLFNPVCVGECSAGETVCALDDIQCIGYQGPAAFESCDGRDNDCDGLVDNGAECPSPFDLCHEGVCTFPCNETEFPCPFGFYCRTLADELCEEPPCRFCLEDPCIAVSCDPGFRCNPETGACVDLCDGVECPPGKSCRGGFCSDCFDSTCPAHRADEQCEGEVCTGGGCAAGGGSSTDRSASLLLGLGLLLGRRRAQQQASANRRQRLVRNEEAAPAGGIGRPGAG